MIKILNLKLVILLEYQNIKSFLQKVTLQIGLKKFLGLKKLLKMLLRIITEKKLLELFAKKDCKIIFLDSAKLRKIAIFFKRPVSIILYLFQLEKDHSMIETRRLKNNVIFFLKNCKIPIKKNLELEK